MRGLRNGSSRFARLIACIIAIAAATPKARIATQKLARTSFRSVAGAARRSMDMGGLRGGARGGGRGGRGGRGPLLGGHHVQLAVHGVVPGAAVLVAHHEVLAGVEL